MKRPSFLLINPWIYDFAAYDMWAKPLGLLYIASHLRARGAEIRLWDALSLQVATDGRAPVRREFGAGKYIRTRVSKPPQLRHIERTYARYGRGPEDLRDFMKGMEPPDAVLVTSLMTYWYPGVFEAIQVARETFPSVRVILGGIYATLCEEHARVNSKADAVLTSVSEAGVSEWLESRLGVHFPASGPTSWRNLRPAFEVMAPLNYLCVMTSRGCPYGCHYCASKQLCPRFEQRDPAEVVEEIVEASASHGVRDVAFYDDALMVNADRHMGPILEELIQRNLALRFHTPNGLHLRELTPELCKLMRRAGFKTIRLGFESADLEWHQKTGGKVRAGDLERALESLWRAGFTRGEVGVYVLVALPGQRYEEAEAAIQMVIRMGARCFLSEYSPIPHTRLWEQAVASTPYDIAHEPLFHNNTIAPCGGSEFTAERLQRLKKLRENEAADQPTPAG